MAEAPQPMRILVDRRPTNTHIREKGGADYHCDVVMCVDQASGYIFKCEMVKPDHSDEVIVAAAEETLNLLRESAPGAQVTWVVRQERVARALARRFHGPDIMLGAPGSFAPWDEAYLGMQQHVGGGGPMLPYLWGGDVTAEEVAELFAAAARFHRAKPWQFLTDSELLKMPNPRPDEPPILVSVMGASGISRGIAVFDSEQDFDDLMEDRGHSGMVYASFERRDQMPHTLTAEAEEQGWQVASKSAFPMVVRVREGKPVPCSASDLRRVTAAFRALGEAASAYRQSRKIPPSRRSSRR